MTSALRLDVAHAVLYVHDVADMIEFYTSTLGFDVTDRGTVAPVKRQPGMRGSRPPPLARPRRVGPRGRLLGGRAREAGPDERRGRPAWGGSVGPQPGAPRRRDEHPPQRNARLSSSSPGA